MDAYVAIGEWIIGIWRLKAREKGFGGMLFPPWSKFYFTWRMLRIFMFPCEFYFPFIIILCLSLGIFLCTESFMELFLLINFLLIDWEKIVPLQFFL